MVLGETFTTKLIFKNRAMTKADVRMLGKKKEIKYFILSQWLSSDILHSLEYNKGAMKDTRMTSISVFSMFLSTQL